MVAGRRRAHPGLHAAVRPRPDRNHAVHRAEGGRLPFHLHLPGTCAEHVGSAACIAKEVHMKRRLLFPAALAAAALLGTAGAATPAAPHTPDAVKNALRILAYVQDDMARKLPTHAYA